MQRKLEKYQKMRDFGSTPEPSGHKPPKTARKPIFVVQKHQATRLHYDFRLEMEGVLKSWAVPKGPSYDPTVKRLAMMTEDHPYDYAAFEGVIPKGNYGAGNVIIWDNGTWELIEPAEDPLAGVRNGKLTVRLDGKKLKGEWALVQLKGRSVKGNEWLLIKHRDGWATDKIDVTEVAPRSVVSGLDLDEIGGSARQWQSNRKASSSGPRTVGEVLREAATGKPRKRAAQASRLPSGGGRVAQASRLPSGGGSKKQKGKPARKKTVTKRRPVKKARS